MKKLVVCLILLAMCLSMFAACDGGKETTPPKSNLESAQEYLYYMYKDKGGKVIRDYEVVGSVAVGTERFAIEWTVNVTSGNPEDVKVVPGDKVTIDVNEKPTEELVYTLVGTMKDAEGNTKSISIDYFVAAVAPASEGPTFVEKAEAGKAYKFALVQGNLGKTLYFAGFMSGNYLATTDSAMNAVDVYLEEVEGGVRFYFFADGAKNYIDIHEYTEGKAGVRITAEPTAVFTYSDDAKTYVANVAGEDRYLGTYSSYNTISASSTTYITGDKAANVGISQFVAGFCTINVNITKVEAPVKGTAYKFFLRQENLGKNLYFAGSMSGNYLATTENPVAAADVYLEEVEGGVRFYFLVDGVKNYIDIHEYTEGKAGVRITTEPTAVFTYSDDAKTYVANVAGEDRYLGTYSSYNTISASSTTYITGEKAANVGVSQFVAGFGTIAFKNTKVEELKAGTAYKFTLRQENLGKDLYFAGYMSGNYLATTENAAAAADVYMEEVDGGVRFYFLADEVKNYIDIHEYTEGKAGVRITAEPTAVFTYSEDAKTYVANVAGEDRYLGTYSSYNTISASSTTYITGEKAANVGVSQFVAYFATVDIG